MKHIVAVNAGPRKNRNTAQLISAACEGAVSAGAEVEYFSMYELEKYSGCISCFGCKTEKNLGRCVCKDGLTPVLESIRRADGLIIGTPNYLGEASSAFRAFYERLIFPYVTYKKEIASYNDRPIPVLFIMTSNMPDAGYLPDGLYYQLVEQYKRVFGSHIGPVEALIAGDTKQVDNYAPYGWTMFDPDHKLRRHAAVFPEKLEQAEDIGRRMAEGWFSAD